MESFPLCPQCQREYQDPADRRFHAQPNACPECGPQLWLENSAGEILASRHALQAAADLLRQGKRLAIKGIGGFHLACDASNKTAIAQLRQGKHRPDKPLAILAQNLSQLRSYCHINKEEEQLLLSAAAPIVLLKKARKTEGQLKPLASNLSPGNAYIGAMLASNPLQHLLMALCEQPLVMSSGNISGEPPCTSNEQARAQLAPWTQALLLHQRQIVHRVDDSVVQLAISANNTGNIQLLRRARGYAPAPIILPPGFEQADSLLALGGDLKCSPCLLKEGKAYLLPYLGDLKTSAIQGQLLSGIQDFEQLMQIKTKYLARDSHPNYISARLAKDYWPELAARACLIQHHHAHLAACLAEHHHPLRGPKVLGLILDGSGYAGPLSPHPLWGAELLLADYQAYQHLEGLPAIALPGGEQAIHQPWRNLLAYLERFIPHWQGLNLRVVTRLQQKPISTVQAMIKTGSNSPLASSCGRLFDAVAALLELNFESTSFEGQAAIALESLALKAAKQKTAQEPKSPAASLADTPELAMQALWQQLINKLEQGEGKSQIAYYFHQELSQILRQMVLRQANKQACDHLVFSGGCTQNRLLSSLLIPALEKSGIQLLLPQRVPANDGGLALGQALIAWSQLQTQNNKANNDEQ